MDEVDAKALVLKCLGAERAAAPGAVLYSGLDTVRPGPVYVMGLNPGGDPKVTTRSIADCWPRRGRFSEYVHSCWVCEGPDVKCDHVDASGTVKAQHLVKHQRNVLAVMAALGRTPVDVLATNAVFARSKRVASLRDDTGADLESWWKACWPMHQALLGIVRPRVIVSLGRGYVGSAFALLRRVAGGAAVQAVGELGRNGGRAFDAVVPLLDGTGHRVRVFGVPHPSWYPAGPRLLEELQRAVTP